MGFKDLFKSTKELEREKRRELRSKERQAARGISRLAKNVRDLEKERAKVWAKARELVQAGQKVEAAKLLEQYKALGVQINRLEKQRMFAQNKLNRVSAAGTIGEITGAIADFAEGMDVNPDKVDEAIGRIDEVSGEIDEANQVVDEAYAADLEKTAEEMEAQDEVSVDDDLMAALESEAAADILGGKVAEEQRSKNDINAGRDRLRTLLAEDKEP